MGARKPEPHLEVFFAKPGLYPEEISVRTLLETLSAIHRLAVHNDEIDLDEQEGSFIRLLDVVRGSAIFRCVTDPPQRIVQGLREAGNWLENPNDADQLGYALRSLRTLSKAATKLDCPIVIRNPSNQSDIIAEILPATYESIEGTLVVRGEKTIGGRVERVGGATATKCALRVEFQPNLLYCSVKGEDVVRTLGKCLYQNVVVTGTARWLRRSWTLIAFQIRAVNQPKKGRLTEAFQALRIAGGAAWDEIDDPERFIREATGRL